jgi:tetrahydromethanopterin S-methyltransferase subunit G
MTDRSAWKPVLAAIAWSVALIPGALFLPIEDPQSYAYQLHGTTVNRWISLVHGNGAGILWIPIVTLVLTLLAAYFLALQQRRNSRVPSRVATGIGVVILVGAVVGTVTFLVGIFLAPAGVLILVASEHSRDRQSLRRGTMHCRSGHANEASSRYCASCGEPLRGSSLV